MQKVNVTTPIPGSTDDGDTEEEEPGTTENIPIGDTIFSNDTIFDRNDEPTDRFSLFITFSIETKRILYKRLELFRSFKRGWNLVLDENDLDNVTSYIEDFIWDRLTPTTPTPTIANNDQDGTTQSPETTTGTTAGTPTTATISTMATSITNTIPDTFTTTTNDMSTTSGIKNPTSYPSGQPTMFPPTNSPTLDDGRRLPGGDGDGGNGDPRYSLETTQDSNEDGRGTAEPITTYVEYNYEISIEMASFFQDRSKMYEYFDILVDSSDLKRVRTEYECMIDIVARQLDRDGYGLGRVGISSMVISS